MTRSPPPEAEHFRGKTLTPESPVPVHIPEPQNIPVLQNQIDPVFNLMSTHMEKPSIPQGHPVMTFGDPDGQRSDTVAQGLESTQTIHDESQRAASTEYDHNAADEDGRQGAKVDSDTLQNHLTTSVQPSVSLGAYESPSIPAQSNLSSFTPTQIEDVTGNTFQQSASSNQRPQDASVIRDPSIATAEITAESDSHSAASGTDVNDEGVNYQTLLDNISPSTSTAPTAENITSITTAAPSGASQVSDPSSIQTPIATLPIPAGLPPRPPPQENPAIHPNYTPGKDIRSYHNPPPQNANGPSSYNSQSNDSYRPPQGYPQNGVAPNGMPPPPLATFQQSSSKANQPQRSPQTPQFRQRDEFGRNVGRPAQSDHDGDDEYPRRPDEEKLYEEFVRDEAIYTSEGLWDRFPQGSRLFVGNTTGNLFTEKVTKRDVFYVFHKYGRLAQISMKSAYGFVQYVDAACSYRALQAEEGTEIKGRKIHLEISKPQKNTRNAAATAAGDNLRAGHGRRSRSPDYNRGGTSRGAGQRPSGDRFGGNQGPNTFERRGRDDYRPMRSPSPRGFRGRDDYRGARERSPERYYGGQRTRSRSPYNGGGRYRSPSPRPRDPDDEAGLPIARRNPGNIPDVQIILVDQVDSAFVGYIQQSFRERGLRCDVYQLPRVSLVAVVKRQIIEGVQAVVKIFRQSQVTGKIPLQVFNRSLGLDNVHFDEYADLDANIAAEIVVRAKSTHNAPAPAPQQYSNGQPYGSNQYGQHSQHLPHQQIPQQQMAAQQPQPGGQPPNVANLITSLDGPALQKLLGAMTQNSQTPQTPQHAQAPPQPGQSQDLAALLSSVIRSQPPQQGALPQGYPYGGPSQQQYSQTNGQLPGPGFTGNRPLQPGGPPHHQQQPGQQQNVQNIMEQLARYRQ